jgi:hypothetical protein
MYALDVAGNKVEIAKSIIDTMSQKQLEQLIKYSEVVTSPAPAKFSTIRQYFS